MTVIGSNSDVDVPERAGLRILMTNNALADRAGSEIYLRDLAISLIKLGHFPVAYSPLLGDVATDLERATIPVVDDLAKLAEPPDIIHGQHHLETMAAVLHFPQTPALYVCHGWSPWQELPPLFPSILRYVAVDDLCRERILTTKGIHPDTVSVIRNFVDTDRFSQRATWREQPRSALIFSNSTTADDQRTRSIRSACAKAGIDRVDLVGIAAGNSQSHPEQLLAEYDVVFAKARCAIEAMATGAAVVVTDFAGLGGMVTSDRFAAMRSLNFGARTMQAFKVSEETILNELQRYDALDARRVSDLIRSESDMKLAARDWVSTYHRVIADWHNRMARGMLWNSADLLAAGSAYLRSLAPLVKTIDSLERRAHDALSSLAGCRERGAALEHEIEAVRHQSVATSNCFEERLREQERDRHACLNRVAELDTVNNELSVQLSAQRAALEEQNTHLTTIQERILRDLQNQAEELAGERKLRRQIEEQMAEKNASLRNLGQQMEMLVDEKTETARNLQQQIEGLVVEKDETARNLQQQIERLEGEKDETARNLQQQMERLMSESEATLRGHSAYADEIRGELAAKLCARDNEIYAIKSSRAWRTIMRYGRVKAWFRQ